MAEQMMQETEGKVIPTGYKQTEVGIIPTSWTVKIIRDLGFDISDGNYSSKYPRSDEFTLIGIPFIRANNIKGLTVVDSDMRFISEKKHNEITKGHLKKGDVLITNRGEVGNIAIVPDWHVGSNINAQIVRINSTGTVVVSSYLAYYLQRDNVKQLLLDLQTGSALKQLPINRLVTLPIAIPPKQEQTAIANVLSDSDALIDALEQLIAKKQAIKSATMQQLLTGRTRLPAFALRPDGTKKGYKPSELGDIPEDWEVMTYGEIFTFLSTSTNSRADLSNIGEYGYIHYGDIHTKFNNALDLNKFNLPRISSHLASSSFIENGDVVMADASEDYEGIGKSVEVCNVGSKKVIAGLHTFLLRDKNKYIADGYRGYLHCIPAVKNAFDRLATGMKVYGLSKNNLAVVPVPVPSPKEQTAIATILSDMDNELQALTQKLEKARALKQGMMQQLLTGKIRLPLEVQA